MNDVIVIGGGIVGASAAYRLAVNGVAVTLVDRVDAGQATAAGAGIISPGTSLGAAAAYYPLAFEAVAYYGELLASLARDGETDTGYETVGLLHVAMSEAEAAQLPQHLQTIRQRRDAGVVNIGEPSLVSDARARSLFPALGPTFGAIHVTGAARVDGRLLAAAMRRAAQRHGATLVEADAELLGTCRGGVEVRYGGETHRADAVIIAGGAWSGAFASRLAISLPIYPQRGQILHLGLPRVRTGKWPILVGAHSHYFLTFPEHRVVVGATREDDAGFDPRLTAAGVHEVLSEALRVAPGLGEATLLWQRVGLRPATPDGLPVLGQVPGQEGIYLATGHGASGLQLGPYSGALVADLVLGRAPSIDLFPYAVDRFRQLHACNRQ